MRKISVTYLLDDEEERRLEALLPYHRDYVDENGERPFADWGIEKLFDALMCLGSKRDLQERIGFEERRQEAVKRAIKEETPALGGRQGIK